MIVNSVLFIKYLQCFIKDTQGMYRELKAFIEESALMCSFNHPHVLGMVGICLDTAQSPYLLLPYMTNGDLRTFLRNKRGSSKDSDDGYPEVLLILQRLN